MIEEAKAMAQRLREEYQPTYVLTDIPHPAHEAANTIDALVQEMDRLNTKMESYESAFLQVRVAMGLNLHCNDNLVDVAKSLRAERDALIAEVEERRSSAHYDKQCVQAIEAERDELLFRAETIPLRDYFAAHAIQALASDRYTSSMIKTAAEVAYDYADAMLEARK